MGAGSAEKGEKRAALTSEGKFEDLLTPEMPLEQRAAVGNMRVSSSLSTVGIWMRLYLMIEALGLQLAASWRDDCACRNARFLWCALAMAFGAGAYYSLPDEPSFMIVVSLMLASALWGWRRARKGLVDFVLLLAISALSGLSVASYHGQFAATPVLQRELSSAITGVIDHIDYRQRNGRKDERWTLRVETIDRIGTDPLPQRLLLVRKALGERFALGERIRLWARLQPLQRPSYPGAFDYARYLWARSIGGQGYMGRKIERLPKAQDKGIAAWWDAARHGIESKRSAIATQILERIKGEAGGLAIALAVGKRDYLASDVKEALRQSGLAHILAISGLHMALVSMSIFWGVRALFALVPHLALSYPIRQWAAAIALICAASYLVLSGGSVATIRAFLMMAIFLIAIILGRPALTLHNLALALIAVILFQPYSLVEAGMQMSFAATAALIASYDRIRVMRIAYRVKQEDRATQYHASGLHWVALIRTAVRWIGGIGATSLIAGVAVLPFSIAHFQQMAPLGLIANLMVMPIISLIVMPFGLVSVALVPVGLQALTLPLVGWGLERVIASARWIAEHTDEQLLVVSGQGMVLWLYVLAIAAYAIHRGGLAWLALAPIGAALLAWHLVVPADLWISSNGTRVAYRGTDQRWHQIGSKRVTIDFTSLLHFDGDARLLAANRAEDAPNAEGERNASGLRAAVRVTTRHEEEGKVPKAGCDRFACFAAGLHRADGRPTALSIGLVRKASAFDEVCATHDIIVSKLPIPAACAGPRHRIGPDELVEGGARFVWFDQIARPVVDKSGKSTVSNAKETAARRPIRSYDGAAASHHWELHEVASFIAGRRPWQ